MRPVCPRNGVCGSSAAEKRCKSSGSSPGWYPAWYRHGGRQLLLRIDREDPGSPNDSVARNATVGYSDRMSAAPKPRKSAARATKRPNTAVRQTSRKDLPAWHPAERAQFLIDTVGGVNRLAKTLGVSPSQPSRWKSGQEVPSPDIAAKLLDLDHVVALAVQTWHPVIVMDWMTTANGFLDGAQPLDVLLQRGSAEVIDALKATLSGAYA